MKDMQRDDRVSDSCPHSQNVLGTGQDRVLITNASLLRTPNCSGLTHQDSETVSGDMKRLGDDILTPIQFLTKKQRKRIVATWVSIRDRLHFVQLILIDVFRRYPHIQDLFRFPGVSWHELPENANFQRQCVAFANFLDYIIGFVHLNSSNFIEEACHQLGRAHADRIRNLVELPKEWWEAFEESIIHYLKPYFVNRHLAFLRRFLIGSYERAWKSLLDQVIQHMQQGFRESRRQENFQLGDPLISRPPNRALELARWLEMNSVSSNRSMWDDMTMEGHLNDDVSSTGSADSLDDLETLSTSHRSAHTLPMAKDLHGVNVDKVNLGSLEDWVL